MLKAINALFAAAVLFAVTGCPSVGINEDTTSPIPEAELDPTGLKAVGGEGYGSSNELGGGAGPWVEPGALDKSGAGADADGWLPVDPQNRLGMPVIYFAYDSDVLVPSETANLDKIAAYLQKNPSLGLVIEGHCDSRGTDEYNRALGERRANAIRAYLAGKGVPDTSMKTMSFGKDKPAVDGSGESIWRQNRRGVPVPMRIPGR
ncbi:MAG: OmpA family protein [Lentisphaeria bacterium]|nr:OmpA family protein [Lentisphaeria bacterium]